MGTKYVIIGGVACGPKTASRIRRLEPDADITIIERGELLSYGGCGLPYYISNDVPDIKELWSTPIGVPRDSQFFKKVKNITVKNLTLAERIDREKKIVHCADIQTGNHIKIPYDKLVLAVGGEPKKIPVKGSDLNNIFKLNHPYDAENIKKAIDSGTVKEAVIIGGGLIGLEVTEALIKNNIKVTIIESENRILPKILDLEMANLLKKHIEQNGVKIFVNNNLIEFQGDDRGDLEAVITKQGKIPAQLVLTSIGVKPNIVLAKKAGLAITENNAIKVNNKMQTSVPDIYAGGDCVDNYHIILQKNLFTPLGDLANIQGRIIANNITEKIPDVFPGITGTAVCKIFSFNVAATGLTEEFAKNQGFKTESILSPGPDKAHFYPDAKPIFIKLIADKKNNKIIGSQIIGPGDVAKRINIVSTGMYSGITIDMLSKLDLAYAPPFSPAIDNIITAANILRNKVSGLAKSINPLKVKEKIEANEDFMFLDVRSPKESEEMPFNQPNVTNIPLGKLREQWERLPKDKEIIIFCKISLRGYEAQRILEEKGFSNVKFMEGGIVCWSF